MSRTFSFDRANDKYRKILLVTEEMKCQGWRVWAPRGRKSILRFETFEKTPLGTTRVCENSQLVCVAPEKLACVCVALLMRNAVRASLCVREDISEIGVIIIIKINDFALSLEIFNFQNKRV